MNREPRDSEERRWWGETPDGWEERPLRHISRSWDSRRKPVEASLREINGNAKYDYYGASGVIDQVGDYLFDFDSILVSEDGANLLSRNLPLVYVATGKYWVNNHAHVLTPSPEMDFEFLALQLEAADYRPLITGALQPKLTKSNLGRLRLLKPPLGIQQQIVKYLSEETLKVEDLRQKLTEQRRLLEKYKRQMVTQTVKRGLDPDAPTENCGVPWLGSVPSHWEIRTLSFLTDENKVKNSDLQERNLLSLSYGSLVRKDIEDAFGLLPASFDGYQIVEDGYIVLRMTDLQNDHRSLRTAIATERGIITNAYIGLIPRPGVDSRYLAWLLRAIDLQKVFYGLGSGVRQSLSYTELRKLPILLPPLDEQRAIADYIDDKTAEVDGLLADIDLQVELLETYRKQLISDVVTGKVRVNEDAA